MIGLPKPAIWWYLHIDHAPSDSGPSLRLWANRQRIACNMAAPGRQAENI